MEELTESTPNGPPLSWAAKSRNYPNGTWSTYASGTSYTPDRTRSTQQVRTPHYTARMKRGELIPYTPFKQELFESYTVQTLYNEVRSGKEYLLDQPLYPGENYRVHTVIPYASIRDTMLDQHSGDLQYFVQAAAGSIYASGWDLLTFVAESKDLVRMFISLRKRLVKALTRGGSWRPPRSWSKAKVIRQIRDDYMESRYGWRPLLFDLQDFYALISDFETEYTRHKKRVGTDVSSTANYSLTRNDGISGGCRTVYSGNASISLGLRGSVCADIIPPKVQINPLVTAWEATRLSFVVDWFLNVGQALNAAMFTAYQTQYTAATGVRLVIECNDYSASVVSYDCTAFDRSAAGYLRYEYNVRVPTEVSMVPRVKVRLDPLKVLDLLSIYSHLFNRR